MGLRCLFSGLIPSLVPGFVPGIFLSGEFIPAKCLQYNIVNREMVDTVSKSCLGLTKLPQGVTRWFFSPKVTDWFWARAPLV